MAAKYDPPNGSELVVAIQKGRRVQLTRSQVASLLATPVALSWRPMGQPGYMYGHETIRAVQAGQPILFDGPGFAAFLATTGAQGVVPAGLAADPFNGAERIVGDQDGVEMAWNVTEANMIRNGTKGAPGTEGLFNDLNKPGFVRPAGMAGATIS